MKYTEEEYNLAKSSWDQIPPEHRETVRARMREYEDAQRPASPAEAIAQSESTGTGASLSGDSKLGQFIETQAPKPPSQAPATQTPRVARTYLPPDPGAGLSEEDETRLLAPPLIEPTPNFTTPPAYELDDNLDLSLPNASGLKKFATPTEYASKSENPLAVLAKNMAMDPLTGGSTSMYFEPSQERFEAEMGPKLQSQNWLRGSTAYNRAYEIYQDAQWKKAYEDAVAADRSITRASYTREKGWEAVQNYLMESSDTAAAFIEGVARGYAGPTAEVGEALTDRLFGQDEVAQTRERSERSPWAAAAGNIVGATRKGSLPAGIAAKAGNVLKPLLPGGALGRYATSALSGAVGADAEVLANTLGELGADAIGGHDTNPTSIRQLPGRLLGTGLAGAFGGGVGELLSDAALAYRNYIRTPTNPLGKELPQLEAAGMTTSYKSGLEPSEQVREILERFRAGDPEKGIAPRMGNPVEYAATDVVPNIVNQAVKEQAEATARMQSETAAALASDTNLMSGQRVNDTLDTARAELIRRSQPEAAEKYAPGKIDALGTYENEKLRNLVLSITNAEPVLAVDAPAEAARTGGRLVSVAEARALGYKVNTPGVSEAPAPGPPTIPPAAAVPSRLNSDSIAPPPTKSAYTQVEDSDLIGPSLPAHPVLRNAPPPANAFTTPKDDLPSLAKRFLGPPPGPPVTKALEQTGRPLPSFAGNLPFPSVAPGPITLPKGVPESEYMVMLTARPYDAQTMESLKESIDKTGKAASRMGEPDRIWKQLIAAVRKDRDQFSNAEWSALKEKHHDWLTRLEQNRGHAGITEDELFEYMQPQSQNAATNAIANYGRLDQDRMPANIAVAGLADRAGIRPALENMSGTRAYISLKDSAAPQLNLGSHRGLVRSMLAASGLRADALARDIARGPSGEIIANVKGLNPEAALRTNEPLGRSLLPSSGLLAMGRGAGGVKTGALMDSRFNTERATGSIDPEQRRIIEKYLSEP